MTIRYEYDGREKRVVSENPRCIADYVEQLQSAGAKILEIISPPPGMDDRQDGEAPEIIMGVKCYVSKIKWAGKTVEQYRFTVPGWSDVEIIGRASTKRMIGGRLAPYVTPDILY